MEKSPSKRRKLSPLVSVPVDASNTYDRLTSHDDPPIPGRATFMSPTKASLSRFNPNLLLRPKSAGEGTSKERASLPGRYLSQPPQSPDRVASIGRLNAVALRPTTPQKRLSVSTTREGSESRRRGSTSAIGTRFSVPPRRSRTPARASEPRDRQLERIYPEGLALHEESPLAMTAEAVNTQLELELQADTAQQSDAASYQSRRERRRKQKSNGEPQLPPTPEPLGLEPLPEHRKGLLSSSPSARVSRRKEIIKSSPLKPRAANGQRQVVARFEDEMEDGSAKNDPVKRNPAQRLDGTRDKIVQPKGDWEANRELLYKKETLRRFNTQLDAMESDILHLEDAVSNAQDPGLSSFGDQDTTSALLALITSTNPSCKLVPGPSKPLQLSSKLARFLPFSRRAALPTRRPDTLQSPLPFDGLVDDDGTLKSVPSLTPVVQSSSDRIVERSIAEGPLYRQHVIRLNMPSRLLSIEVSFTVDTTKDSVASLSLNMISPWADQELGSWIRSQLPTGDVSSLGWACGRYWDLAVLRARTWARFCQKFPRLLGEIGVTAGATAAQHEASEEGNQDIFIRHDHRNSEQNRKHSKQMLFRSDIHVHLGRQSLKFSQDGVALLITWSIGFDWTGDAESQVSACAAFPQKWRDKDKRGSLENVANVFERLVKDRGVSEALRVMVGIIFKQPIS